MKLKQYLNLVNNGKGMTIANFSKKLGISQVYLGTIVREQQRPSRLLAEKIEMLTNGNVKVSELLDPKTAEDLSVLLNPEKVA